MARKPAKRKPRTTNKATIDSNKQKADQLTGSSATITGSNDSMTDETLIAV